MSALDDFLAGLKAAAEPTRLRLAALLAQGELTVGVRANALRVQTQPGDVAIKGEVELAEISGSDTFVHVHSEIGPLVAQLTGVHYFELGRAITLYLHASQAYVFDSQGLLMVAPQRGGAR